MPNKDGTGPEGQAVKMKKRIAIPTESGVLCSHFGHCESFYIADIENNKLVASVFVTPPAHEPGLYPAWVKEQGVSEVICGGIGQKARDLFDAQSITVYYGADKKDPENLIQDHLNNMLKTGQNECDH